MFGNGTGFFLKPVHPALRKILSEGARTLNLEKDTLRVGTNVREDDLAWGPRHGRGFEENADIQNERFGTCEKVRVVFPVP